MVMIIWVYRVMNDDDYERLISGQESEYAER